MFQCHSCGATSATQKKVNEFFQIDNRSVVIENIPALVCDRCGEETFLRETTEHVREIVHGQSQPVRAMHVDVFQYV